MDPNPTRPLDYETVCRYVGQLFLETRHKLEQLTAENVALKERLKAFTPVPVPKKE